MSTLNERNQYITDYKKENIKRVPLDMQKKDYDKLKSAADNAGETVNGFIKVAIRERIEKLEKEQAKKRKQKAVK